jgi:hypothetical protein
MDKKVPWWALVLGVLFWVVVILGVRHFWPRIVEIEKRIEVPVEKIVEIPAEDCSACKTVHVNLQEVSEDVWSSASGLLLAEGWCAVIYRDQAWQEDVSWQEGATEDYLLICNPGPGSRFFSLQDEYGGRPENWWNDQTKETWFFCLPNSSVPDNNIIAVLYENDDEKIEEGWKYSILLDQQPGTE